VRGFRAQILYALTLHLLGRRIAKKFIERMENGAPSERCRALRKAVSILIDDSSEPNSLRAAIRDLRRHDAGGFANAFLAIPAFNGKSSFGVPAIVTAHRRFRTSPEIIDEIDATLNALIARLESADSLTAEHSRAVSSWCARLARRLGMTSEEVALASRSGLVHDVGKLRTPAEILNAPRSLSAEEWQIMRAHALVGESIVLGIPIIQHLSVAVRSHHERIDGKGYPDGIKGLRIPTIARLVAVADCFNAMIGRRPYRKPMPPSIALMELERHRGTQFDPEIVDAMIDIVAGPAEKRYA
jgi:putative nucleotidyltransferase with HDIG domain